MSDTDDHSPTCCFCLGSDIDIPPFGTISDAKDLISPCSTCSIASHRKCLLDWFNSVPSDKLQIIYAHRKSSSTSIARNHARRGGDGNGNNNHDELGVGAPPANQETNININFSTRALGQFLASVTNSAVVADQLDAEINHRRNSIPGHYPESSSPSSADSPESFESREYIAYILVPCPQCKQDIVFSMNRSSLLALQSSTKSLITRGVQYGGVFLGITSAMTGILSMGYIGLTTCGIKMMDCIVPSPILIKILTKKSSLHTHSSYQTLNKILFGESGAGIFPVDNLEQGLMQGLIDPFKFLRIPVLPIVMYRSRTSSIFQCFFGKEKLNSWITEAMIFSYISSMSDHMLVRVLAKNFIEGVKQATKNPWSFSILNLIKGIDWTNSRNIISLLVPIRWLYDLFYRLTFNREYFNMTMRIRPRAIANSLSSEEVDDLEDLNNQFHELTKKHIRTYKAISKKIDNSNTFKIPFIATIYKKLLYFMKIKSTSFKYLKLKLLINLKYTLACLKHDYSHTFSHQSIIIKSITTILWPFLSSKLSHILILPILSSTSWLKFNELSTDKKVLIGNIVGLVAVSIVKELCNMYLVKLKVNQMANIQALNLQDSQIIKEVSSTLLGSTLTEDPMGNGGAVVVDLMDDDDDDQLIINGNDDADEEDAGQPEVNNFTRLAAQLGLGNFANASLFNDDFPGNFPS
ncbi:hypothetical protein Cantr_06104 [Candida viswanathii]|uniref:Uncharacterized protein n=1 Tax=Candida viswanathii TaxID=5486 RepID=A0A367XW30_9ASCO|nr:hypothetical protein Cantr_06104 [Candida viswanathii]